MSEFELLAQDLLEKAEAEEQLRQENDKKLLGQVLEIYDQKYVAELLRKVGKNEWSRETLNRWINGKCSPKTLTLAEEELLRKMLPEAPAHHPDYAFRFIDLFAGIGGIRKGFETIGGQCVFTSEWNKEAVRTYKANWFNDAQEHTFNLDIRGTVAKLAMRQPFVLFKGLTFQKLCLPGAFRPGDHHNKMLRPGLCVVHASPQYL